jgi:transposase
VIVVCAGDASGRRLFFKQFSFLGFSAGRRTCPPEAILSAVREPNMRFVSVKSVEQQSILACHRMRQGSHAERTALINRTRGLLAEFGVWLGRSAATLCRSLPRLAQDEAIPPRLRRLLVQMNTFASSISKSHNARSRSRSTPNTTRMPSG